MAATDLNVRVGFLFDEKSLKGIERSLQRSGQKLSQLGSEISIGISAPLGLLGIGAIKAAGEMESLKLAMRSTFEGAGKSIAEADQELQSLRKAALAPGLDFEQAVKASIRLQAVDLSAQEARKTIVELANSIALTGGTAANLESVTVQFSQIISKNKVLSQDLRIVQENLPVISKLMKQAFGTSNAEDIQKLGITGKEFVAKITEEMGKLPRVAGGISNAIVNVVAGSKQALATIGTEISKAFDLPNLADKVSSSLGAIADGFAGLSDGTKKAIVEFGAILVATGPVIKVFGVLQQTVASSISVYAGLLGTVRALPDGIAKVAAGFSSLNTVTKGFVVIGVAVALYEIAKAFGLFDEKISEAEKLQSKLNDLHRDAEVSIAGEKGAVDRLIAVINDETASKEAKADAINKLKQISPEYFGQLKIENGIVVGLTSSYDAYVKNLLLAAKARKAEARLIEIDQQRTDELEKQKTLREELAKISGQKQVRRGGLNTNETGANTVSGADSRAGSIASDIGASKALVSQLIDEEKALTDISKAGYDAVASQVAAAKARAAAANAEAKAAASAAESLSQQKKQATLLKEVLSDISRVKDRQDLLGSEKVIEQAKAIENGINRLLDGGFTPASKAVQNLKTQLQGLFASQNIPNFSQIPTLPTPTSVTSTAEPAKGPKAIDTSGIKTLSSSYAELGDNIQRVALVNGLFGASQDTLKQQVDAVKKSIQDAIDNGYSPQNSVVAAMIEQYKALNDQLTATEEKQNRVSAAASGITAIGEAVASALSQGGQSFQDFAKNAINAIGDVIGQLIKLAVAAAFTGSLKAGAALGPIGLAIAGVVGGLAAALFKKVVGSAAFAQGTSFAGGGLSLVGEQGPELVNLPRGSQVFNNSRTNQMLSGAGGMNVSGEFRMKGTDMVALVDRVRSKNNRIN